MPAQQGITPSANSPNTGKRNGTSRVPYTPSIMTTFPATRLPCRIGILGRGRGGFDGLGDGRLLRFVRSSVMRWVRYLDIAMVLLSPHSAVCDVGLAHNW